MMSTMPRTCCCVGEYIWNQEVNRPPNNGGWVRIAGPGDYAADLGVQMPWAGAIHFAGHSVETMVRFWTMQPRGRAAI